MCALTFDLKITVMGTFDLKIIVVGWYVVFIFC
jgi:hypothetical protein